MINNQSETAMKTIDFEAHFYTQDYMNHMYSRKECPRFVEKTDTDVCKLQYFSDLSQPFVESLFNRLLDLDEGRLRQMDKYGIDVQILSLSAPGIEQLEPQAGAELARKANDELAEVIRRYPDRFQGYAALAPKDPDQAADELERSVTELGFKGWNTHSNFGDSYLDDQRYWPILERAEKLGVPVYLHPTVPAISQLRTYGFALAGAPFGFGLETAMTLMRIVYNGVFDRFPNLQIILGHLGEALPFLMKRIDWAYVRPFDPKFRPSLENKPSDYLRRNVFVTTSGNYYEPAFRCTVEALGIDKILLGTDYPYDDPEECMQFITSLNLSEIDLEKIFWRNSTQIVTI
jgi:predicted TIM-barrel fold metal-dependent hydrolase